MTDLCAFMISVAFVTGCVALAVGMARIADAIDGRTGTRVHIPSNITLNMGLTRAVKMVLDASKEEESEPKYPHDPNFKPSQGEGSDG